MFRLTVDSGDALARLFGPVASAGVASQRAGTPLRSGGIIQTQRACAVSEHRHISNALSPASKPGVRYQPLTINPADAVPPLPWASTRMESCPGAPACQRPARASNR